LELATNSSESHPTAETLKRFELAIQIFIFLFVFGSPFSISLTQAAFTLGLLTWIGKMIYQRKFLVKSTPLDYIFLAYLIFEMLAMFFSPEPVIALKNMKRMLLIPIVYLIANNLEEEKFTRKLIITLILVTSILAGYGIFKYLAGVGGLAGRLRLFHHWMTSGGILMMIALLNVAFLFTQTPRKYKIAATISLIPILLSLIFTFTRSSWLGFLGGLVLIAWFRARKLLVILLVIGLIAIFLAPAGIQDRIKSIVDPTHPNNVERLNMWQSGWQMLLDRPLTGYGDIDLGKLYQQQYKLPTAKENVGHLHNNLVHLGATLGVPGILVFLALMIMIFIQEYKIYSSIGNQDWLRQALVLGCLAVLIGFNINGLFEWNFGDAETVMIFWLTVGFSFALPAIKHNQL